MCGRYATTRNGDQLARDFLATLGEHFVERAPDYNMAPTKQAAIVVQRHDDTGARREIVTARWGLIPSWSRDEKIASRLINARSETVAQKPSFRSAFAKRRAIIPVDGYYEWHQSTHPSAPKTKQPFYLSRPGGLNLAGLYEWWQQPDGEWRLTFSILTTSAEGDEGIIHDRAPLHVPADLYDDWLAPEPAPELLNALVPATPGFVEAWPVSDRVNAVRNNGAELARPLPLESKSGDTIA
ncbi:MAG: SOS response-associated peptidase [Aeromicrobium sp.]|nr:MAG: SOS response-associated peptidase [Aeromicrobium sp.]